MSERNGVPVSISRRVAGSNASDSTEIYAEGVRIPPLKMYDAGEPNETFFTLMEANVRVPVKVFGDFRAQLAGNMTAKDRVLSLIKRYGADTVKGVMRKILDDGERAFLKKLALLPDGVWRATVRPPTAGGWDLAVEALGDDGRASASLRL